MTGMRLMLHSGTGKYAPWWLGVLQMSEAWGVPPWEVVEARGSLRWGARWAEYKRAVAWVEEQRKPKT